MGTLSVPIGKKIWFLPVVFLFALLLPWAGRPTLTFLASAASAAAPPLATGADSARPARIVVVDDASYAPFSFLDADDQPAGISIDLWRLWSRKTGIEVEFRLMQWNAALLAVQQGQADVVGGIFKTAERQRHFDFTSSSFVIATKVFFHEQIHGIRGLEDLQGFRVGIVKGDSGQDLMQQRYPKTLLQEYGDTAAMIRAAVAGEIKVLVADLEVGRFYLAQYDQQGAIREAAKPVATNPLHSAVKKGNHRLLAVLDEGFSRISEDEIKATMATWTGSSLLANISWSQVRLFSAGIVALVVLILLWNIHLRKTVAKALRQVERRNLALRDSEARFKAFFALAPFSCVVSDLQGRYRMVNESFCHRCGLQQEQILGKTPEELGLFFNREEAAEIEKELMRTGEVTLREGKLSTDRGTRSILYSSRLMEFDGEQLILSATVDITDRRQAEAALRESEERFSKAFSLSPAPMVISDIATGRFIDVNEQWLRMLEHSRAETIGSTSYAQGIWEDPEVRARLGQQMQETGAFRDEPVRFVTKSGQIRDVLWSAVRVNLSGAEVMLSLIYDYSQRKQAEDALRESESYNKLLFHDSHIPLAVLDGQTGRFVDCNQAAVHIYGFSHRLDLVGKTPGEVSIPVQSQGQPSELAAAAYIRQALDQGSMVFEWQHQRPNGEIWDSEVHLMSFVHRDRQLIQLSLQDITGRKQAELEKERLQHQLLQAQKMESIGRLAGGVAHDFNNMLAAILGHAELALYRMDPSQPSFSRLGEICKAAERAADLTRQLLAFARRQTVALKILDLNQTVAGMLTMLRRLIGEHIELIWRPGESLGVIKMDPSQIDQILVNLCVNGRDAIGDTGKLTIETAAAVLDPTFCASHAGATPGDYVQLMVADNGCGIDAETRAHLFEPFFTTKETGKGTGLGLATVYGIVKQNNGYIEVDSEPGQGTSFRVYLPRHLAEKTPAGPAKPPEPAVHGQETILLVEDETTILDITRTMLELHGYRVLAAATPGEALRRAREHVGPIDLLMTDVIMPEMNGRDLANTLQSLLPDLKGLFMSGYTADVIAHHGVLDEGVHFIQKPFSALVLAQKVREALGTAPMTPEATNHDR